MLKLGKKQNLIVVKEVNFGIYLADEADTEERILLPKKQVPQETKLGDSIEVFVYKDSSDRLISTVNEPKIQIGTPALLRVADTGAIGAFLDWGLEKDLLLPFKEQTIPVKKDDEVLVALYVDKSSRLCATTKLYDYLSCESPYKKDDKVTARVYDVSEEFGIYVAVDDKFSGRIPPSEYNASIKYADVIEARVSDVKDDGKLDLSVREKAYIQMDEDAQMLYKLMEENSGKLNFTDKASPEIIKREAGLSKNAFKRAVGRLLKEGRIEITKDSINIIR